MRVQMDRHWLGGAAGTDAMIDQARDCRARQLQLATHDFTRHMHCDYFQWI